MTQCNLSDLLFQGLGSRDRPDQSGGPPSTGDPDGLVSGPPRRSLSGGEVEGSSSGGDSYSPLSARDGAGLFSAPP